MPQVRYQVTIKSSTRMCVCLLPLPQFFLFVLQQLKALEISIESFRTSTPKAKFAFKRRPPAQPQNETVSVSVPVTATSQSPGKAKPSIPATSSSVMISSQSNKYITRSLVGCEQTDLVISELDHCVVDLLELSRGVSNELKVSALHVRNLTRCVLLLPPVAGSALLQDLTDCVLVLGCHQVGQCRVWILTTSELACSSECIHPRTLTCFYPFRRIPSSNIAKESVSQDILPCYVL